MIERYKDWDDWKKTIGQVVKAGSKIGVSDQTMISIGSKIGDFLNTAVEPENREQRVIKELWDVGSEDEQLALTSMLVKMLKAERKKDRNMQK